MQENPESQEKKVTKGDYFEVPGVPIAESKEKKVTKGDYFEVPGVPIAESKREAGARPEGKKEKEVSVSTVSLEREEPKESEFKPQGELETGYTEESWSKPERGMEEKATVEPGEIRERKAADETREVTGYTEESWSKPERDMEEKVTIEPEERREQKASEEAREETKEAKEEVKEVKETKEAKEELKEAKEAKEEPKKAKEEARGEKRTTYTMKKRLTKSKKERMLFGVCGGLGEYFGIDPTFIRLAFAALALYGIGIVLYIVLAILLPSEERFEMVPSTPERGSQR